jgi:hypothetical protein
MVVGSPIPLLARCIKVSSLREDADPAQRWQYTLRRQVVTTRLVTVACTEADIPPSHRLLHGLAEVRERHAAFGLSSQWSGCTARYSG